MFWRNLICNKKLPKTASSLCMGQFNKYSSSIFRLSGFTSRTSICPVFNFECMTPDHLIDLYLPHFQELEFVKRFICCIGSNVQSSESNGILGPQNGNSPPEISSPPRSAVCIRGPAGEGMEMRPLIGNMEGEMSKQQVLWGTFLNDVTL